MVTQQYIGHKKYKKKNVSKLLKKTHTHKIWNILLLTNPTFYSLYFLIFHNIKHYKKIPIQYHYYSFDNFVSYKFKPIKKIKLNELLRKKKFKNLIF